MPALTSHPLWRNVVLRTVLYYAVIGTTAFVLREYTPADWGVVTSGTLQELVGGAPSISPAEQTTPTALAAAIAMLTAFATALPVAWIYTATRRKKGFQQSIVQTYLILPVVAAGIVITVKHSLQLAFALAGIVAAVRFRTTLDDSKDAAGIFVVIGIGMAAAVAPSVSWVISIGFNILMLVVWWTDFGRPPAMEGRRAEQLVQEAINAANQTGMFVAQMDEKVLDTLAPEQLDALIVRAQRQLQKRRDPRFAMDSGEHAVDLRYDKVLVVRSKTPAEARRFVEEACRGLVSEMRYIRSHDADGERVLEWGVSLAPTVATGVVLDALKGRPDSPLSGAEFA